MVSVQAAATKSHTDWVAYTTKIYCLTVPEPRVQTEGVGRAVLPLKAPGDEPLLRLPASEAPGALWLLAASLLSASVFT